MKPLSLAALGIVLAGCAASHQYFEPTEHVEGRTPEGRKLATYPLAVGEGSFGEVKVWSEGAYETKSDETLVRIGLEVHNTSGAAIELKPGDPNLEVIAKDYGPISGLRPEVDSSRAFPPGTVAEVRPTFALPPGISPRDIEAMRLHWRVQADGLSYAQSTPFTEEVNPVYYGAPYGPYGPYGAYGPCGPYGCGAFGWGFGFGGQGFYAPYYITAARHTGGTVHHGHGHHGVHGHGHRRPPWSPRGRHAHGGPASWRPSRPSWRTTANTAAMAITAGTARSSKA